MQNTGGKERHNAFINPYNKTYAPCLILTERPSTKHFTQSCEDRLPCSENIRGCFAFTESLVRFLSEPLAS